MRLRHLYTGELTWRELISLVQGLPAHALTRAALNDGKPEPTAETIVLTDVFDMLQNIDWHIQAQNAEKRSQLPKKPKPYPRWWDTRRGKKHVTPQRQARIKDAQRRAAERRRLIAEGVIT